MNPIRLLALLILPAATVFSQIATTPLFWPDKQGPTCNGVVPDSDKMPLEWDEKSNQGIAWKTPLEDEGHSTPVIGGDLIWFTAATKDGKKNFVYCVNRQDGKILQHKLLFENEAPEELGNPMNNYAAPSCVLEGDAVFVTFGTYGTARLDPKTAAVVWQRRDINVRHFRGPGSSPVVFENLLILTFDGIDKQFTIALDKQTGKEVWQTPRSTDYHDLEHGKPIREGDMRKAFGTPALIKVGNDTQLVSVGSRAAYGYDARTGKEIWRVTHGGFNAAVRPLVNGDTVFMNTGYPGGELMALKINAATLGDVTAKVLWNRTKYNADFASAVLVNDHIFQTTAAGVGVCVKLADGTHAWSERIFTGAGKVIASAIATKDRVYFFNEGGAATVIAAAPEFRVLARNKLDSGMTASPAAADGALYLRTKTHLYKIVK
ncbi:MAG: PQQ-binding-like beta-propeller repeat protein [Verrucomicrobia bacterium]|nr:PQQ-binding-like beta-propeller repeat protein [Verrucomicrobiota bacterium]